MADDQLSLFGSPPKSGAKKLQSFAECASAIDGLFRDALESQGPSAFTEFLEFARRMSNLSVYNAMLVRVQRPGASAVATQKRWIAFGRLVKPGAIPIVVLRPFGPVSFLYEAADTEGRPLPGEDANPFMAHGDFSEVDWARAKKHHREENRIHTEERNFGLLLAGNARNLQSMPSLLPDKDVPEWLVQVNSNHTVPTRFATFAHELGHIFCGHCGAHPTGKWPNRSSLSYAIKETEAEAVSYLVCARQGLTVASQEYLSELIRDVDLVNISLYSIFEAANRVEGKLFSGA